MSTLTEDLHGGVQLIDGDGNLLAEERIQSFLESSVNEGQTGNVLQRTGVNYHVVGVFGGQSSGKSTLLNHLFHTKFQTMDEKERCGQTTKGVFMTRATLKTRQSDSTGQEGVDPFEGDGRAVGCHAIGMESPLFVVDFEGTDGIERGENQNFERQLSLFALSVADVLIINMWAVDVGRFNAANMSLLRTVFEVNLQLFSRADYVAEEKPTLLVVLRDFTDDDATPHFKTVRESLDKIWSNIQKPEAFAETYIDALFELRYHCLPHYKLQRAEFNKATQEFREWFTSPGNKNFLFRSPSTFRGVPLDGVASYISSCWDVIRSSRDLDIPSQRDMLARHRCIDTRRSVMQTTVVEEAAAALERELLAAETEVLEQYAQSIGSVVVASLDGAVGRAVDDCVQRLLNEAHLLPLIDPKKRVAVGSDVTPRWDDAPSALAPVHESDGPVINNVKCAALVLLFWNNLCSTLQAVLDTLYELSPEGERRLAHHCGRFATSLEGDGALREGVAQAVTNAIYHKVFNRFSSMAENAAETIHRAFEHVLTRKADGAVRFYRTADGLLSADPQARQAALVLLDCLVYFRMSLTDAGRTSKACECSARVFDQLLCKRRKLNVCRSKMEDLFFLRLSGTSMTPHYPLDVPVVKGGASLTSSDSGNAVIAKRVLLSEQAVQRAFDMFVQKCEFTVQSQLRNIESSKRSLPPWVLPVMLFLGMNELYYVLTSPLLLLCFLTTILLFFKQYVVSQWEAFQETGPVWIVMPLRSILENAMRLVETFMPTDSVGEMGQQKRPQDPMAPPGASADSVESSDTNAPAPTARRAHRASE
uniref:GB1/RHD3-type G domain-containing protein n=1 Tax=Trypanosoma vivax (strain Y486) TaxID=1055687 RepID=G0U4J1_TRYVY|nr:conserved hypothetical protein, fragment [Trypanosoma vivax Y486]